MRVAHLADTHLAYFAYHATAPSGANQRSVDVANAFRSAVDAVIAAKVDIVLIAGDFFHMVKPSNPAIIFAFDQFGRLRDAGCRVVLIAGNHDTPRSAATGSILGLFTKCGVDVAVGAAQVFRYPDLDLRVVAVPHQAVMLGDFPALEGPERFQVLLAHAEVQGVYRKKGDALAGQIPASVLNAGWSAVCLGDYHICHQVAENAWYPGSLEYTSSNPWAELHEPKGWLLWDLETGTVERRVVPLTRRIYDLSEINAADLDSKQVDALIAERLASVDIVDAVLRLKVLNLPRSVSRGLDRAAIRQAKGRALHLKLDFRVPDLVVSRAARFRDGDQRKTLSQIVADYLAGREYPPGIDGAAVTALGAELLAEADAAIAEKRGAA